ncbi:MAG: endonuclease III [Pseudomonadota bacterium]
MTPAAKATRIGAALDELFPRPAVPLHHTDPFTLLVATILSAQTTDRKVNEVTPALFTRAPTPAALAALPEAEIHALIRVIGLANAKARHLRAMAALLVARHGGEVPRSFAALEALPGVGHKTASVVMAGAFGEPAFPVDTHVHRLAWRWGLSDGRSVSRTEHHLEALFPPARWHAVHLQMIYFGREYCPALRHDWAGCPICAWAGVPERREEEGRRGR